MIEMYPLLVKWINVCQYYLNINFERAQRKKQNYKSHLKAYSNNNNIPIPVINDLVNLSINAENKVRRLIK